jgi:hypothetical protein
MNSLSEWMARAMTAEGAVVEPADPESLAVLLPPSLQDAFRCGELVRLGFGATTPEDARRVTIESEWVDILGRRIESRGRLAEIAPGVSPGKPPDADEALRKGLVFDNATYRFTGMTVARTRYRIMVFRVAAVSDEKREDVIAIAVNESNAARSDSLAAGLLEANAATWIPAVAGDSVELPARWTPERIRDVFGAAASAMARTRLAPFLAGMERRMGRDLERLHAYHEDLRREAIRRHSEGRGRKGTNPDPGLAAQRLTAIEREYEAKVADIRRKYGLTVELHPLQTLLVTMPVHRLAFVIRRRKGERVGHLDWNPLTRRLDSLGCEACGALAPTHSVCDDRLHVVCSGCLGADQEKAKPYCHACREKTIRAIQA